MHTFFEKWALLSRHDHAILPFFTRNIPEKHAKKRRFSVIS